MDDYQPAGWNSAKGERIGVWLVLLCLALPLRLLWLNDDFYRDHYWNEGHYACTTRNISRYGPLDQRNDTGRDRTFSPFVPLLLWPTARLSGWRPWGFRLPLALTGLVSLAAFHALARRRWGVGAGEAWLGLLMAATTPGIIYFSRNIQLDGVATTALFLGLLGVGHPSSRRMRILGWLAWSCCILAKTTFLLYLPAMIVAALERDGPAWRNPRRRLTTALLAGLCALPLLAWMGYCFLDRSAMIGEFLLRPSERSTANIIKAILRTPAFLRWQLDPPLILFALLGFAPLLRGGLIPRRRWLVPLWLAASWMVFIFSHPVSYIANQYYTYPALYVVSLLAAGGIMMTWRAMARIGALHVRRGRIVAGLLIVSITVWNVIAYPRHFGGVFVNMEIIAHGLGVPRSALPARIYTAHGVPVFKEAELIGEKTPPGGKILVDFPSTMFHAGADPERVECAYGPVEKVFDPRRHQGVLLPCHPLDETGEAAFAQRLQSMGWRRISPRGWMAPTP